MTTPLINEELVLWIETCVDTVPRKKDSPDDLRWKGAQKELTEIIRNQYELQKAGQALDQKKGFRRKSDD